MGFRLFSGLTKRNVTATSFSTSRCDLRIHIRPFATIGFLTLAITASSVPLRLIPAFFSHFPCISTMIVAWFLLLLSHLYHYGFSGFTEKHYGTAVGNKSVAIIDWFGWTGSHFIITCFEAFVTLELAKRKASIIWHRKFSVAWKGGIYCSIYFPGLSLNRDENMNRMTECGKKQQDLWDS